LSTFDALLQEITKIAKVRFAKDQRSESETYEAQFMGLFIFAYPHHDYGDELDMDFSNYEFVIDIDPIPSKIPPDLRYEWAIAFSKALSYLLQDRGVTECMITDDLQEVIAKFPSVD
jgi:hypothetical protein